MSFTSFLMYLVSISMCLGLLSGCAVKPPPTGTEMNKQALPETTVIPEQFNVATDSGKVDDKWLASFNDSQLNALVKEAMQNNLNLRTAQAQVERASALSRLAGAALKPTVGYGAEVSQSSIGNEQLSALAGSQRYNAGLGISWELDVWGRIRAGTAAAEESLRATQADYEFARQSLAAAVAKSWFISIETKLLKTFSDEVVSIMEQTLEIVNTKNEIGQISKQDVHLASANLSTAENARQQSILAYEQSTRSLETLLGRYPSGEIRAAEKLPEMPALPPVGLPSDLLARRPDLQAAESNVAAAFYVTQQAELAKLPSFSLSAAGEFNNLSDTIASLAAGIYGPLYTGGAIEAQIDIANADQKAALAQYGQKVLKAFQEVESGLIGERTLVKQEQYLEETENQYREALNIALTEYEVGKVDLLSVLIIQGQWIGSKIQLINIQDQRLLQRVNLHLALGGSFSEPTE